MKHKRKRWFFFIPLIFLAAAAFFGWAVMALWNAALVPAAGVAVITFWQALGILVLSRILVGGFGRRFRRGHHRSHFLREKWMNMTPEEREKLQSQWGPWRGGCGHRQTTAQQEQ